MTAPHINTEHLDYDHSTTREPAHRRRAIPAAERRVQGLNPQTVKPEWDTLPNARYSNTAGSGMTVQPRQSDIERADRLRSNPSHRAQLQEPASFSVRVVRRLSAVLRSPGGLLSSVAGFILVVGLSPVLTHEEPTPTNSTPPAISIAEGEDASVVGQ